MPAIHIYHHFCGAGEDPRIGEILRLVRLIVHKENQMATDVLAPLVEEVRGIKDASESIHTIVVRLADLIESGGADPAEIQALAEQLRGSAAVLADAALIGTAAGGGDPVPDPEPTPEPEPEPEPTPEP